MQTWWHTMRERSLTWFKAKASGPYAVWWLAFVSFLESFILPIPTVVFLIALLMVQAHRWLYLALVTAAASVVGGVVGYIVGAFFFETIGEPLIAFYKLEEKVTAVTALYDAYAFGAVLIGAFTPLPYKIFALSAGFLHINFVAFVIASIVGRVLQFGLASYLLKTFGARIAKLVFDYFSYIVFGLALVAIVIWFF